MTIAYLIVGYLLGVLTTWILFDSDPDPDEAQHFDH